MGKRRVALSSMVLLLAAAAFAPRPALAQSWQVYSFPDAGFAVQFTAAPTTAEGVFKTVGGVSVPARIYAFRKADARFAVTVADLSATAIEKAPAIEAAVERWRGLGEIKLDVEARIDREFGRQLSVLRPDGDRTIVSIFFVGRRLYVLEAEAAPEVASDAIHFQQSLELIGLGAEALRPENRPQGQGVSAPGGPADGRRPMPPPEAFRACEGKAVGTAVEFAAPRGLVAGTCAPSPGGLVARPDKPPPGREDDPG